MPWKQACFKLVIAAAAVSFWYLACILDLCLPKCFLSIHDRCRGLAGYGHALLTSTASSALQRCCKAPGMTVRWLWLQQPWLCMQKLI